MASKERIDAAFNALHRDWATDPGRLALYAESAVTASDNALDWDDLWVQCREAGYLEGYCDDVVSLVRSWLNGDET